MPWQQQQQQRSPTASGAGYRPLAALPEQAQHSLEPGEQGPRDVTSSELFFDLFIVGAISNISGLIGQQPTAAAAGRVLLYHALTFFIWSDYTTLKTRFRLHGLVFRVLELCLQLGLLGVIIGIRDDRSWYRLLAGGYCVVRAATAIAYAAIAVTVPNARGLALLNSGADILLLLVVGLAAAPAYSSERYPAALRVFVAAALLEAAVPLLPVLLQACCGRRRRLPEIPVHVDHMSQRLSDWTMLHLGEAITGFAMAPLVDTTQQFVGVALAACLVWCLHLAYWHIQPTQQVHAFRQSRARGLAFFFLHWPLAVALLVTGAALRTLLGLYPGSRPTASPSTVDVTDDPAAPFAVSLLLCVAYASSLHLLALVRAAHYFSLDPRHRVVSHHASRGVARWYFAWWLLLWLWPVPVYLLPLAVRWLNNPVFTAHDVSGDSGDGGPTALIGLLSWLPAPTFAADEDGSVWQRLSVTGLLGLLAGHAVLLTCAESLLAHVLTRSPAVEGLQADSDGGSAEGDEDEELAPGGVVDRSTATDSSPLDEQQQPGRMPSPLRRLVGLPAGSQMSTRQWLVENSRADYQAFAQQ